jgi:hypothetical protein
MFWPGDGHGFFALRGLDFQQPDERRLVLLLERDDVEDAEPLASAENRLHSPDGGDLGEATYAQMIHPGAAPRANDRPRHLDPSPRLLPVDQSDPVIY